MYQIVQAKVTGLQNYRIAFLNPPSVRHPSYVKETYNFVEIVKNLVLPSYCYFFSMDVVSLYTNIDIDAELSGYFRNISFTADAKRPDEELLKLLDINLLVEHKVVSSQFYLQVKGSAMGKRCQYFHGKLGASGFYKFFY